MPVKIFPSQPRLKRSHEADKCIVSLLRSTIFPYAFGSSLWIVLTDQALSAITFDIEVLTQLQILKGVLFAIVSSLFLYSLVRPKWQSLSEHHQLLQAVLEGTKTPIFLKDRDSRYILVNSTGAESITVTLPLTDACPLDTTPHKPDLLPL